MPKYDCLVPRTGKYLDSNSMQEKGDAKGSIELLEALQRVQRFSMAAMSLSRAQREALSERWPAEDSLDVELQSRSSVLRSAYGL